MIEQKDLTPKVLADKITEAFEHPQPLAGMAENMKNLGIRDAAQTIVKNLREEW